MSPVKVLTLIVLGCLGLALCIQLRPSPAEIRAEDAKANKPVVMLLDVSVNRPDSSRGYRKPYVAIWISDKDNYPVRTLALWVQTTGPGPSWIPTLKQWHQNDLFRQTVEGTDLVDGVSGATRTSGDYKVGWDGLDNDKQPLPPGEYTLYVEAAREHGTYQLSKATFTHGTGKFTKNIEGNTEIKSVEIDYRGTGK